MKHSNMHPYTKKWSMSKGNKRQLKDSQKPRWETLSNNINKVGIITLYIKKCYTSMLIYKTNNKWEEKVFHVEEFQVNYIDISL